MLRVLMRYLVYCRDPDISKVIRESNIIILTSVTNFTWDVPIGQIAARKKIKIIAIPRSWDNFTSHGAIRVKPHKIFSFSASMTRYLITYHFFNHAQIIEVRNPAYDYEYYKPIKNSLNPSRSKKILYACMGSYLHENESIFINHLSNIVKKSGFELEILMHPKFETSLVNGIHCNVIPYDKFSTVDLLKQHLSQFRLILTAGSSIAIDCYNYGLDFCCIFIEVLPIDYWRSILRYVDTVEHFSDFLAIHDVRVLKNFNQIAIELESLESNQIYKSKTATDKSDHTPLIKDALLTTINCILSP
jgi:hypothetical protein